MSFTIELGHMGNSAKRVNKTFKSSYSLSGVLKEQCSIKDPVITIKIGDSEKIKVPDITTCNYAYIKNFNRYYYITDFVSVRNTLLEIHMHEDVLKSFEKQIYDQEVIVQRMQGTSQYTWDIYDPNVYHYCDDKTVIRKLKSDDGFTKEGSYVMVTAGPSAAV